MRNFYFSFASLITLLLSLSIPVKADTESIVISFLKKQVTSGQNNISGQYIYDELLTDVSKEWIESIECKNVKTRAKSSDGKNQNVGVLLDPGYGSDKDAYLLLTLKPDKLIRAKQITVYTAPWGSLDYTWRSNVDIDMNLSYNDTKIQDMPNIPNPSYRGSNAKLIGTEDIKTIQDAIDNGKASTIEWKSPELTSTTPLKTIEIGAYQTSKSPYLEEAEVYAVKIEYDKDFKVAVNEIEQDDVNATPEFFDLMGRKLYTVPANGIYIMKTGGKVRKILAR